MVGCGSIGSQIALQLSSAGVGKLRLLDHDVLGTENIHRHVLGMESIGQRKALALKSLLTKKFPHMYVDALVSRVEDVVETALTTLLDTDLILIALGDETLETWLNGQLLRKKPRVHVWVEPLGLGQHVLAVGKKGGCFECLFEPHDVLGKRNRSSFSEGGQNISSTIAGCGGSYIEFSANDAICAAVQATTLVDEILQGRRDDSVLVSRFGSSDGYTSRGLKVSRRARRYKPGEIRNESAFQRKGCRSCDSTEV